MKNADSDIKTITTRTLRRLNRLSVFFGYNRNLADRFFRLVDPKGTHVISILMVHEHAMMRPVDPHYRVMLFAKMKGQTEPYVQPLDIPFETWDSLPGMSKAQKRKIALASLRRAGVA